MPFMKLRPALSINCRNNGHTGLTRRSVTGCEPLESRCLLTNVSGDIITDTLWDVQRSPYVVQSDVRIRPSATLTIQPGVVIQFRDGTGIDVEGRLLADGSPFNRIQFTRADSASRWDGLTFRNTLHDNRMTHVNMSYGDAQGEAIYVERSRLFLDGIVWSETTGTILELFHPSLIVRNSTFPTSQRGEIIHGARLAGDEYLIIEGNTFANSNNGGDVIDFLGADRPGPVMQVLGNVFLGGGDDGLDLDGTDAHIEGNMFMNFRRNTSRSTTSNAIATGLPQTGDANRTDITVVRNIFVNNDHAILLKEDAYAVVEHNVFVDTQEAVIQFSEIVGTAVRGPGRGASLEGNIFHGNARLFKNLVDRNGFRTELTVDRSLLPNDVIDFDGSSVNAHDFGAGNIASDPRFVDASAQNFRLEADSPAKGTGPNGLDMGSYVEGKPTLTTLSTVPPTFKVSGPGITEYRYRLDDGPLGPLTSVEIPIQLDFVPPAGFQLHVYGKKSSGEWFTHEPAQFGERIAQFVVPRRTRAGESLPMVVHAKNAFDNPDNYFTAPVSLQNSGELSNVGLKFKQGVATLIPTVTASSSFALQLPPNQFSFQPQMIEILPDDFPVENHAGIIQGDVVWDATREHRITEELTIPKGSTLTLNAGTRVLLDSLANVNVEGTIISRGSSDDPVLFQSLQPNQPWGGIEIERGTGNFAYTFFTNGGADTSRAFGHSQSQPVLLVNGGSLSCDHCHILDAPGKGFGASDSHVTIHRSVVANTDTGGEFVNSVTTITGTHIRDIPSDDGIFVDDDNDGLYFKRRSFLRRTVPLR